MKLAYQLTLAGLATALGACGSNGHCNSTLTVGQSFDEYCYGDAGGMEDVASTTCSPSAGTICTVVGTGRAGKGAEGIPALRTALYTPEDIAIGPNDTPYIVDWNNHRIRVLDAQGNVETVAGAGEVTDSDCIDNCDPSQQDQIALQVRLNHPTDITFDAQGRMAIAAWHNSEVKRVDFATGIMSTLGGTGARSYSGDGGPALSAALNLPVSVAYAPDGSLWVSDQANQRIRRIDLSATPPTMDTVVGNGMPGYTGDEMEATMAQLNGPTGQAALPASKMVFDAQGNLYIADTGNNCVRRVDTASPRMIHTFAGQCGMAGNAGEGGPATAALLNYPVDVEIGPDGTIYIADTNNHCIRAVNSAGVISTVAGQCGMHGNTGDGMAPTSALLNHPFGIDVDSHSNLWIADSYNHRIRLVCSSNGGARCASTGTTH